MSLTCITIDAWAVNLLLFLGFHYWIVVFILNRYIDPILCMKNQAASWSRWKYSWKNHVIWFANFNCHMSTTFPLGATIDHLIKLKDQFITLEKILNWLVHHRSKSGRQLINLHSSMLTNLGKWLINIYWWQMILFFSGFWSWYDQHSYSEKQNKMFSGSN